MSRTHIEIADAVYKVVTPEVYEKIISECETKLDIINYIDKLPLKSDEKLWMSFSMGQTIEALEKGHKKVFG